MAEISDIRITQMSAAKGGGRHLLCCEDRYFEANDRVADLVKTLQLYPDSLDFPLFLLKILLGSV